MTRRFAASQSYQNEMDAKLQSIMEQYKKLPEFVREDLMEGLLVGGLGVGLPVALMPNQDPHEQAAAVLGGISAATLGGALARRVGARLGGTQALEPGTFKYNLARSLGREDLVDAAVDAFTSAQTPTLTGADFGRALGRAIGDEVSAIGGTMGALALAQQVDTTPDDPAGPSMGQVALGTIPGAAIGMALSGLQGGLVDFVGINKELQQNSPGSMDELKELLRRHSVWKRKTQ